jgi:hypothetical protein
VSVLMVVLSNMTVLCLHETTASPASEESTNNYHMDDNDESSSREDHHHHHHHHDEDSGNKTNSSSSSSSTSHSPPHKTKQEEGRLWGAAAAHEESSTNNKIPFVTKPGNTKSSPITTTSSSSSTHHHTIYQDPFSKGFQITSRVYTDIHDKKAHFDDTFMETMILPYWECGVTGSTTVPIPVQHVQVRHLLGGAKPSSFSVGRGEDNFGPQPQLVVALTPLEIILNSGQQQSFVPGDVILLENVMAGGHKLQGIETSQNMICLLLTLPNPYHHIGKDKNSLETIFEKTFWKHNPCQTGLTVTNNHNNRDGNCVDTGRSSSSDSPNDDNNNNNNNNINRKCDDTIPSSVISRWSSPPRAIRRVGLGVIGAGLSLALADFLGKCAPFILAVAFGGGALVVGGTYGVVKLGEYGIDEIEVWTERRLLRLQPSGSKDDNNNNNNNNNKSDNDGQDVVVDDTDLDRNKRIDSSSSKLSPETDTR